MKTLKQTKEAIKRFERKYKRIYDLMRAVDRFYMRNRFEADAFNFVNDKLTKLEHLERYSPKYKRLW